MSILSFGSNVFAQEELLSGLYFSSHEVIQDKRTSLNLSPNEPYIFPKGFSLEFDANFRKGDGYYGYIFRIIGDGNTNIDLVSNSVSSSNFSLVYKDKILLSYKWTDLPNAGYNKWLNVRVDVNVKDSKLAVSFNGIKKEVAVSEIANLRNFEVVFGACKNGSFPSTDVSPMSLKNVRIYDYNNKLFRDWQLSKHGQGKVYDETTQAEANVSNPIWIRDKHVKWEKIKNFNQSDQFGIAIDDKQGRLFFADDIAVYIYSIESQNVDTIPVLGGSPYHDIQGKQIIYNKFTNELWSYNFESNTISKFNFLTQKWSFDQIKANETNFAHQNKFISPLDSSLFTIMGYGYYTYKSVVNHYNPKTQQWRQIDRSDQIEPRYLSGAGFLDDQNVLVFGGYGSKSGKQELSPEFYYDLYSLNLHDYSFKKLWTLNKPLSPFVPCETLITDPKSGSFYTLLYNSGNYATFLHLARFGIEKNEYQLYDDSIPYSFLDVKSWSALFLDKNTSQLIAVTSHDSEVSLYSMAYPPLMSVDVYQKDPIKLRWFVWFIAILFVCGLAFVSIIFFKRKKGRNGKVRLYEQVDHPNIVPIAQIERKLISSILFIGGFQIYDSKGCNITHAFSPTLKHLFLYIFLHSVTNGKGVSSAKLDEVFWYDKFGVSARNNRNVNISKLRAILDEIEGVEVVTENSIWKIKLEDKIFCDYLEILNLLRKLKSSIFNESEILQLISLLSMGEFLPTVQTEWMDLFKSQFANETIDGLSSLFNNTDVRNNFSLRYHLAECILVYDPLNEEAFAIKCSVLYGLGKKGMAKNLYDSFCREYKQTLGIAYAVPFNDTIK